MVYSDKWPSFNGTVPNATSWYVSSFLLLRTQSLPQQKWCTDSDSNRPDGFDLTVPSSLIPTVVDDLFGFNEIETHPIFPTLPKAYNTVFNHTSTPYGHESVYLLATSATETYTLCSIRVVLSPDCSTEYNASNSGGSLTSHCAQNNLNSYISSQPKAPNVNSAWSKDWVSVASEWGLSLSLNDGIIDGASSNARLLTQLIPTTGALNPSLPSISEALAVLAGCTLMLSSQGAPFIHCKPAFQTYFPPPQVYHILIVRHVFILFVLL